MSYYKLYQYDELYHHGIQGQKWGVRRYQNEDGSLTEEGRIHYYGDYGNTVYVKTGTARDFQKQLNKTDRVIAKQIVRGNRAVYKAKQLQNRLTNGANAKKDAKIQSKIDKQKETFKESLAAIDYGKKRVESLVGGARAEGYKVDSKSVYRYADYGRDIVNDLIFGHAGVAIDKAIWGYRAYKEQNSNLTGLVRGQKYTVDNDPDARVINYGLDEEREKRK